MEIRALMKSLAMKHPDVATGVACKGTPLESTTYNTNDKAFLFVGPKDARLKRTSGWVKIDLAAPPSEAELTAWIAESYALMAKPAKAKRTTAKPKAGPAAKRR